MGGWTAEKIGRTSFWNTLASVPAVRTGGPHPADYRLSIPGRALRGHSLLRVSSIHSVAPRRANDQ